MIKEREPEPLKISTLDFNSDKKNEEDPNKMGKIPEEGWGLQIPTIDSQGEDGVAPEQ